MHLLGVGIVDQQSLVLAAVIAAVGLLLMAAGWFGLVPPVPEDGFSMMNAAVKAAMRPVLAAVLGLVGFSISGWPVLAFFGALLGWFTPTLLIAKRERKAAIARVDAIATWVETVRDNISGAAGLQQALRNSGDNPPAPIRNEVRDLALRLQHEPVVDSLRRFAADLAHPTSDMAVGCLILASTRAAGNLTVVLANTAQAARDSASMMRQIEAGRVAVQSQAKLVATISGVVMLGMILKGGDFVDPYDTLAGQAALFVICSVFAACTALLYRLSLPEKPLRVFRGVELATIPTIAEKAALEEIR